MMAQKRPLQTAIALLFFFGSVKPQRWSRQVQSTGFTGGLSDWVPVQFPGQPQSSDRQTGARVLNFAPPTIQQTHQGQHSQQQIHQQQPQQLQQHQHQQQSSYIPQQIFHQPQPQQINFNGAGEPFQLIPANQQRFQLQQQSPAVQYQMVPPAKHVIGSTPHLFGQQQVQSPPSPQSLPQFHYTQLQPSPSAFPPHQQQPSQQVHHQSQPQFVQERPQQLPQQVHALQLSPAEINQQYQFPQYIEQEPQVQSQPQQIQHVLQQQFEVPQTPAFVQQNSVHGRPQTQPLVQRTPQLYGQEPEPIIRNNLNQVSDQEEEVQLLYVPLETLNQQNPHRVPQQPKPQPPTQNNKYNVQPVNPLQINNFYTSSSENTPSSYSPTTPSPYASSPAYTFGSTSRFNQSPATTPKPKPKSHQPPLAMFMLNDVGHSPISVNDVLKALKNAKNIDVLDSATKQSPKVFVGPSGLRTPNGYSKFELPYLSSIEQNRAERQVNKLPFFVAPLSYKAPNGFAKIPLPAPHVGSVVINSPPEVIEYQSVNLQVPQRTQTYPKKVQSQTAASFEQTTPVFRQSPKYNSGFKFGSDVFTTTAKPSFYSPSSTRAPNVDQQYNFVSTTPSYKNSEQYSHNPSTEAKYPAFVSSTQQPQRQQEAFTKTRADDLFSMFVSSTQKPQQQFEQFDRRPQSPQTTTRSVAYQAFSAATTPSPAKNNRFEQYQSARPVSSTQAPLSTYSSQQHEEEYSNFGNFGKFNAPQRSPSTPTPQLNSFDNSFFKLKSNPTSSVQSEEYFNVKKPQAAPLDTKNESKYEQYNQFKSSNDYFITPSVVKNETKTEQYNQYKPSNDYFITPSVTSSASSASAPKPTESELYSFQPIIGQNPSTARPDLAYTSKPTDFSTRAQEILKMKSYFREQNAHKTRPSQDFAASSTSSYDFPSSSTEGVTTESNFIDTKPTTSAPRKITYYTPSPHFDEDTIKPVQHFKYVDSANGQRSTESYKHGDYKFPVATSSEKSIYNNHRETYQDSIPVEYKPRQKEVTSSDYEQTETPYNVYTKSQETKNQYRPNVEINNTPDDESSNYNLPSELPPISAHLPGLVNSLYVEQTESEPVTTTTTAATTRRTINRGRRPQTQTTRSAVSRVPATRPPRTTTTTSANTAGTDTDEYSTRRTTVRGRRPIHYANRTTTLRTPTARNPNRVRYNPTSEERQRVRTKQSKIKDEDLEYQRDVLNQNYPVITKPTSTELPSTTESRYTTAVSYAHETERYSSNYRSDNEQDTTYEIPANHSPSPRDFLLTTPRTLFNELPSHFSGLEDHMQIPQEHQALHGAFYNSESDVSAAEAINGQGVATNHPVFLTASPATSSPTSTTEEVTVVENLVDPQTRRRQNFLKRPTGGRSSIVTSTTTPYPTVTQTNVRASRERFTIRPFTKQDAATVGYTPKPRLGRLRTRPTTTLSTPTTTRGDPEVQTYVDESYQQISRFNKDFYQDAPARTKNTPQRNQPKGIRVSPANDQKRFKYDRFALDAQESQWSTKLSQNSFIPVDPESTKTGKSLKKEYEYNSAEEPEIVTAGSLLDDETEQDSYMLKVGSSFAGTSGKSSEINDTASSTSETSFVDLLEKAMSDVGNEIAKKQPEDVITTTNAPTKSEASTDTPTTQAPKRRGVWKRVRVRPVDGFETAESQNYGHRVFNGLPEELSKESPPKSLSLFPAISTDDVDESESPRRDELTTTASSEEVSPTNSEALSSENNQTVVESVTTTTTEEPLITMLQVERLQEREDEPVPVSTTTVSSTRRYDQSEEDLIMEESDDDHTEFPFSFDGVNDEVNDAKTESPITERSFYEYYDASDYKTESTLMAREPATPDASPASSMMSEVKQKLAELFSFSDDYEYENNVRAKQQPAVYTTIDRTKSAEKLDSESTISESTSTESDSLPESATTEEPLAIASTTTLAPSKSFHKKLMESVIYATSTSTEVSHETEICYRGRCIKSDKKP